MNSPTKERLFTRVLCVLLGTLFIFGPTAAEMHHYAMFQQEIASSSMYFVALLFLMIQLCGALGVTFIWVGIVGVAPSWLRPSKRSSTDA